MKLLDQKLEIVSSNFLFSKLAEIFTSLISAKTFILMPQYITLVCSSPERQFNFKFKFKSVNYKCVHMYHIIHIALLEIDILCIYVS